MDDLMGARPGGIIRGVETLWYVDTQENMTMGSGAWPDNAEIPLMYDERDAKV
ncbi:MAG TPA: hypothetical protein VIT62_08925 [Lysobacter sp.]